MFKKPDNWNELTWQQKRAARFAWWRAAQGVEFESAEAKERHDRRVDRLIKAICMEELPDRVPVDIVPGNFPAYYAGYDFKTVMYDGVKMKGAWLKFARDFDMDSIGGGGCPSGLMMDYMGSIVNLWPGGGLPDNASLTQFVEAEYMKFSEVDACLANTTDYILRTFLPRTYRVFAPLSKLGPLDNFTGLGMQLMMAAGDPAFGEMARMLVKAHEAAAAWSVHADELATGLRRMGYPAAAALGGLAPFDTVGDMLRGTHGSVMDMFRQPEKLLELLERITPVNTEAAIRAGNMADNPMVLIPMHKGDDMFMSPKQFEKFYWPSYRRMLEGIINEGLVPSPVIDGTYNKKLEYLKDLPRTGVVWTMEKTDMALAKRVIGNHTCIAGNVTAAQVFTQEPEQVAAYCRRLIDVCAPGGGYILSMGSALGGEGRVECLHQLMKTAKEYGKYTG
jgi:hypothetical protein